MSIKHGRIIIGKTGANVHPACRVALLAILIPALSNLLVYKFFLATNVP